MTATRRMVEATALLTVHDGVRRRYGGMLGAGEEREEE
jgi:hypothetical protein